MTTFDLVSTIFYPSEKKVDYETLVIKNVVSTMNFLFSLDVSLFRPFMT